MPQSANNARIETWRLGALFAAMYFVQGIAEPTEGLLAQPVRAMLDQWGQGVAEIAAFSALLALPWSCKPIYGLLTDFVPFVGRRRKSYLVVASAAASGCLLWLALHPVPRGDVTLLFALLVVPTIGVAFLDVVVDALLVERAKPRGLTGVMQSVQWGALYAGSIFAGWFGGWVTEHKEPRLGFVVCGIALAITLVLSILIREPRQASKSVGWSHAALHLGRAARSRLAWAGGAFIFLWNFNPFSSAVLQFHFTERLHFSQQFYGDTVSISSVGSVLASFLYGGLCRRLSTRALLHSSIVAGIASTAAYWGVTNETSAAAISLAVGFAYMLGLLAILDLAARACLAESAGTMFALLMSLANLATSGSTWLGGIWYEHWELRWDSVTAFNLLVGAGAAFTAGCWLLLPSLCRCLEESESQDATTSPLA